MFFSNDYKNFLIPANGSYIKLFANNDNEYTLITTGDPDLSEYGLPNPIYIKILSNKSMYENVKIIKVIFDLTFVQPESFSKLNLPFLLNYKNDELYKKIPDKYSIGAPF